MLEILLTIAAIYWLHMTLYYFVAQKIDDVSIIDIAWGAGPALAALSLLLSNRIDDFAQALIATAVLVWGARLALHIYARKSGSGEDKRYQKFRDQWGDSFNVKSYFFIFMVQALLSLAVTLPLVFVAVAAGEPNIFVLGLGIALWLFGFYFEARADAELSRFIKKKKKKKNKKKVLTTGVWRYTRHPNYFGEVTQWWGLYLACLSFGLQAWWVLISPLMITYLIFNVSGLNILEEKFSGNKEWEKYKKKTPKFFPKFNES